MKPSSLRMRAISRLVREAGTTTSVWRARDALRTRVSMSAIGSETFIFLPARLRDAGQLADERALAEADAAEREAAHVGARPAAHRAPVIRLDRVTPACASAFAIRDFLAIWYSSPRLRRRRACRAAQAGACDSSSVFAVVTMLISSPRRRSTLS